MKVYEFLGGGQVSGATPFDIVNMMWRTSFEPTTTIEEYMEQTARRCHIQRGADIRTTSVDSFVEDLVAAEFLIPVSKS